MPRYGWVKARPKMRPTPKARGGDKNPLAEQINPTKNAILALNFLTTDCPFAVGALCRSQRDRLTPSVCPSRQRECCHCAVPCAEKQLGEEHCCLVARDFNWAYGAYCIEGREPAQDGGRDLARPLSVREYDIVVDPAAAVGLSVEGASRDDGRRTASGGKSHLWVTAPSLLPSPRAKTISVALGSGEQCLRGEGMPGPA